jgi:transposase-like protein
MDDVLIRFRQAADRENRRRPLRRRYSAELQQRAVEYWQQRRGEESVRAIAASLGMSLTTLLRWTRASARRSSFRPVAIVDAAPSVDRGTSGVVIQLTAAGPRVEGLTIETAARLLTLLR